MTPNDAVRELLRGIQTEIGAGMVLFPKSAEEHAHNNACERANKIVQNYRDGFGLFQMTRPELAALTSAAPAAGRGINKKKNSKPVQEREARRGFGS